MTTPPEGSLRPMIEWEPSRGWASLRLASAVAILRITSADEPHVSAIGWDRWDVLFADERCVPADDADSNFKAVDDALKQIKDAVIAMDGKVEVASVDAASGAVELRFKGPSKVRFGIEAVVRDVEDVREVTFVEFE